MDEEATTILDCRDALNSLDNLADILVETLSGNLCNKNEKIALVMINFFQPALRKIEQDLSHL